MSRGSHLSLSSPPFALPRSCLCHEVKVHLSSLWLTCQSPVSLLTHTRPNCLTRPQRSLLIPKQSLRVWACEDECCWDVLSRFWRLFVGWAGFDSDIRGFPKYGEGLRWELFNDPAVDLTSGLGEVAGRVMVGSCGGILTHALVLVFAQIGKSQWICLPLGA